jgi:uncharacterized OsmC-like protein
VIAAEDERPAEPTSRDAPGSTRAPRGVDLRDANTQENAMRTRIVETPYETAAALITSLSRSDITIPVQCELVGRTAVRISLDPQVVKADEPRALGGGGTGPAPTQYALAAIGSCAAITYGYWSYKLGTPIDQLRVDVQGDIDLRGFLGLRDGIRPGFGEVRIRAMVSGPEPARRYEELQRAVARHSPVRDMFTNRVPVTSTIAVV